MLDFGLFSARRRIWVVFVLFIALLLPACVSKTEVPSGGKLFKVAYIYAGQPDDQGWTYAHERGRQRVEAALSGRVETTYTANVDPGPDAARIMRRYVQEGYAMIFATAPGYMNDVLQVSQEFPDVKFEHCAGVKTNDNMSTYFGRMYQPRYLSGIVAGKMTQNGNIGYVAAFPVPEVIRGINAFTLGVRLVNPDAEVHVVWTNTAYDPAKEREAAVTLLDAGADIIAQHQDTIEPQKAAQERGMLSIGNNVDMRAFVGDTVLTGPVWNWGRYYVATIKDALAGTWTTHRYWGGLEDGVVELAGFSPKVPRDVQNLVAAAQRKILAGNDVFCGPLRDQEGDEVVAAGACMNDDEILGMRFFVAGVVGTIPEE